MNTKRPRCYGNADMVHTYKDCRECGKKRMQSCYNLTFSEFLGEGGQIRID